MGFVPTMDFVDQMFPPDEFEQENWNFSNMFSCDELGRDQMIAGDANGCRKRKSFAAFGGDGGGDGRSLDDSKTNKRVKHRDVERQRRHELAELFKTLRSMLPLEYIKGKRSSSDHVQEAVKYIKDLQTNIEKLNEEREKLKRNCETEHLVPGSQSGDRSSSSSCSCREESSVMVMPCLAGVEIVLTTCVTRKCFRVSRVLRVLTEQKLTVIRCVSTRMQGRFIHTIVSEVEDIKGIVFSELQAKILKTKI